MLALLGIAIHVYRIEGGWVTSWLAAGPIAQWAACVVFVLVGVIGLRRAGERSYRVAAPLFASVAVGLVGAWLVDGWLTRDFENFGLSLAGAVLLGSLGAALGALAVGRPALRTLGLLAPAGLLGAAVARLGCLLAGCDYGAPSSVPWSVHHGWGTAAWRFASQAGHADPWSRITPPLHPFALYESLLCLLSAVAAATALRRGVRREVVAVGAGLAYALSRGVAELFRGGAPVEPPIPLAATWLAVAAVLGLILLLMSRRGGGVVLSCSRVTCLEAAS